MSDFPLDEPRGLKGFFAKLGRALFTFFENVGGTGLLFFSTLYWALIAPAKGYRVRWKAWFAQMVRVGVKSVPITCLVLMFVGVIIAFQMAYVLKTFGALPFVADAVGIAMTRELAPLLTAIVMSGYVGASIAAEIGTMQVSEEIMALETSALNPIWFLAVPRIFATIIMVPCLTVIANYVGIAGGWLVSTKLLGIDSHVYISRTIHAIVVRDVVTGLIKSEAFAIVISAIACYLGFNVQGGAEGVGRATTMAVVYAIISIILVDCLFTAIFFYTM